MAIFAIAFLLISVIEMQHNFFTLFTMLELLGIITAIYIINKRDNPSYKIAWIVFILALPVFGLLVYMLWGGQRTFPHLKRRFKKCTKETMKKDELEKYVIDSTVNFFNNPEIISKIADEIIVLHSQMTKEQSILHLLQDERAKMQKALNNIMQAIEEGIFTPTTKSRMNELEGAIAEIDVKIAAEEIKLERTLKKSDVEGCIIEALQKDAKTLVQLLVEKVVVYEDKIEITYKYLILL